MSNSPPEISVVLPVRNGMPHLEEQLAALAAQDYEGAWEVIIVNDGSLDSSGEVAQAAAANRRLWRVVSGPSAGLGVAKNTGAAYATSKLLAFCDADDVVSPRWVRSMVSGLQSSDLLAGRVDVALLNSEELIADRPHTQQDGLALSRRFLPFVIGCNMGCQKALFDEIGGFRNYAGTGGEDIDLSWRLQLAGASVGFAPEAVVHYRYRGDRRALFIQYYRYGRGFARLSHSFASHGLRHAGTREVLKRVAWILVRAPRAALDQHFRGTWLRRTAYSLGALAEGIKIGRLVLD